MKEITIDVISRPRELGCKKRLGDILNDYAELDTKCVVEVINGDKVFNFSMEDYQKQEDGLTRKELFKEVQEIKIINHKLNSGNKETYTDKKTGEVKERQEVLNTLHELFIKL